MVVTTTHNEREPTEWDVERKHTCLVCMGLKYMHILYPWNIGKKYYTSIIIHGVFDKKKKLHSSPLYFCLALNKFSNIGKF